MNTIHEKVKYAQNEFRKRMESVSASGGLTTDRYVRFLSAQYHLTKGVQKHFFQIAAHSSMAKKRQLRDWLVNFAKEEEFHFEVAKNDLKNLGKEPLPCPLDTKLWWLFFDSVIESRPFIRLGATCILENIADGSADILDQLIAKNSSLNRENLKFLIIHRHGPNLAHGEQVLEILENSPLSDEELSDLGEGADLATTFYLRFAHWMITGEYSK